MCGFESCRIFKGRIIGFIGIGAAIPVRGGSFVSCLPFPLKLILPIMLKISGTKPPEKVIERGLCADLTKDKKDIVVKEFTPEAITL